MSFSLNAKGVQIRAAPSRYGGRAIKILGVLAILLGDRSRAATASATGDVGEQTGVQWRDVVRIKVYPRERVVSLCDSWHTIQRLYCPPEVFDGVVSRVQAYAAESIDQWEEQKAARLRPPWGFYAVWTLLAVGATLASGAWYWAEPLRDRIALLAGLLVLLSGLLSGVFAWLCGMAGIITSLITLGTLLLPAMERKTYAGLGASYGFEIDTELLLLSLLGTIVLLGMSAFRVLARGPGGAPASRRAHE